MSASLKSNRKMQVGHLSDVSLVLALVFVQIEACRAEPTMKEYLAQCQQGLLSLRHDEIGECEYRIGCIKYIQAETAEDYEAAGRHFLAAFEELGEPYFFYRYYGCVFQKTAKPETDAVLNVLTNRMVDLDIRLYVVKARALPPELDYLILLLDDRRYTDEAMEKLRVLDDSLMPRLVTYLDVPHRLKSVVEQKVLSLIRGREKAAAPGARECLDDIYNVQKPRVDRYYRRLILAEVDEFTRDELAAFGASKLHARQAQQKDRIYKRLRPAWNYLDSRAATMQRIIDIADGRVVEVVEADTSPRLPVLDRVRALIRDGGQPLLRSIEEQVQALRQEKRKVAAETGNSGTARQRLQLDNEIFCLTEDQEAIESLIKRRGFPPLLVPIQKNAVGLLPLCLLSVVGIREDGVVVARLWGRDNQYVLIRGLDISELKAGEQYIRGELFAEMGIESYASVRGIERVPVLTPVNAQMLDEAKRLEVSGNE